MKFKTDFPPETRQTEENTYKSFIDKEINDNFRVLNNQFLIERLGGIERSINNSLIPSMFGSPEHASTSISYLVEYFKKNNIPTEQQLQFIKAIQLSLNDIQLLAEDKNATYEYVQFAYQWAGLARDKWNLSQESIKSILNETTKSLEKEKAREDIPYLTSLYLDPENMLSRKSKIDRFMQNMTPNLIDEVNHIYHFDPTGENPIFLKLDTEEKKKEVEDFLAEVREGWDKMFKETPTVKTYTHYELPGEFQKFVLSDNQVRDYFPHIAFTKDENVLRGDMKNMLNPQIRESLQRDIGVDLTQLQQEQAYFIEYISNKKRGEILPLKNFVNTYGKEGLKTFISSAHEKKMGDKILTLSEKLPVHIAREVFSKYGEIINNVSKITEFTKSNFTKEIKTSPEFTSKIEETLYIKGKQLLSQIYDDIVNEKEIDNEDIGKQLDRINADTITTFAIFKQAVKNGEKLPIESIEGSIFSKKVATDISDSQKKEMIELYDRNYKNHPDREFISKVKEYFETAFNPEINQSKNHFYLFEKDVDPSSDTGKFLLKNKTNLHIRAFVRFEEKNDNSLYASALNVDEPSKNFGLGEAMMDEALSREAQEHILRATCLINNPSNMRYFEKGFISEHFKKVDNTEQLDLVWDENKNKDILAKQKSIKELISMYLNDSCEGSIVIRKESTLEKLHSLIPEGKALVRCFKDPIKNDDWYAVYETISPNYGVNTLETE